MEFTSKQEKKKLQNYILPRRMAGTKVRDHCHKNNLILQTLPFQNPQWNMLHQGMDADDYMWLVLHQPRLHLPEKNRVLINKNTTNIKKKIFYSYRNE